MAAIFLQVLSGQNVSSAFAIDVADLPLAIQVPSHVAGWGAVRIDFTTTSGTGPYGPLQDRASTFLGVWSGAGPGWGQIEKPPTPWGRVSLSGSASDTMSFAILSLNVRG